MILKLNRELYPKEALLKAAYHFIDKCYIHVDVSETEYSIELISKKGTTEEIESKEFENEILAQTVRYQVYSQTHTIREILMARAMASTITGSSTELTNADIPEQVDNLDSILMDWFDRNDK